MLFPKFGKKKENLLRVLSSLVFMTNDENFCLSLFVAFFIEAFTFGNVDVKCSFLQVLIYFLLPITFLHLVCNFSNDLIIVITFAHAS